MTALADADQLNLAPAGVEIEISIWNPPVPNLSAFPDGGSVPYTFCGFRKPATLVLQSDIQYDNINIVKGGVLNGYKKFECYGQGRT